MSQLEIEGQLSPEERRSLVAAITEAADPPKVVLEVGTWLGGGSTLSFLRALEHRSIGRLWGIEENPRIYEQMLANLRKAAPEALHRFTPLFGRSDKVIPKWLKTQGPAARVDLVFLDGGDNPMEQVTEFQLLDPHIPVGGQLFAHDARLRKGRWLVPYLKALDHWETEVRDISAEGLLSAKKVATKPSEASRRAAARTLRRLRLQPVELAGRYLPAPFCALLLRMLPKDLSVRISQGRK